MQWYYRGSLTSCNYSCSYCPFAKRKNSFRQREQDRQQLFRFVERLADFSEQSAVLLTPYGEALIHDYYWEGMARLSRYPAIQAVGAQTNLSFPVDDMLSQYRESGGDLGKLRLWATYHPEMVQTEDFLCQCRALSGHGIAYCAGTVGVPENIGAIRELRRVLPEQVYLWINKMDGRKKNYSPEEIRAFLAIDLYFTLELERHPTGGVRRCRDSRFVTADGQIYPCVLSRRSMGNLYSDEAEEIHAGALEAEEIGKGALCDRKACSCYLAYNNTSLPGMESFGDYPAFRIPFRL